MKKIIYTIAAVSVLFTSCVKDDNIPDKPIDPPAIEGGIVLNEVLSNGAGDDVDWIELFNGGTEAIDVSGYMLNDAETTEGGWAIPNGTTIEAGGFIVFDENEWDFGGVGSSGEWVSFANASGTLLDKVDVPDMSANAGLTYARELDGKDPWAISSPTKGESNGDVENVAPILDAEPMTEHTSLYSVSASDADGVASVKLVYMQNEGIVSLDMSLVDGKYRTSVPQALVGDVVKYYVIATDKTGLSSVYPEEGTTTPLEFTVVGGIIEDGLTIEGEDAGNRGVVTFMVSPYYADQVDEIRLYYLLPGENQDDVNDDKTKVVLTDNVDGTWSGDIPAQNTDDVVRYYLRIEYKVGTKTYFPIEEEDAEGNIVSDFDHDNGTTWPSYTVEEKTYTPVEDKVATYTDGPLTKVTFPKNPIPGTDINVVLEYTSGEEIIEARIYFDAGNTPKYVKANKIKGEDDATFSQTGVTINVADLDVEDTEGTVVGTTSDDETKVSFYVRIATETAEYYYGNDGSMYLDDTPDGGTTDQSDDFKADPTLWNVYNVQ